VELGFRKISDCVLLGSAGILFFVMKFKFYPHLTLGGGEQEDEDSVRVGAQHCRQELRREERHRCHKVGSNSLKSIILYGTGLCISIKYR